jgi:polygalacturonase
VIKGLGDSTDPVRNVLVENCVVWNDWGRALEIGAETCAPEISNVVFRDCDIVRISDIAMDVQHGDRAAVRNILFENIRLEMDDVYWRYEIQKSRDAKFAFNTNFCPALLVLEIVKTMWSHDQIRGTMENVTVRNCSVTGKLHPASRFRGFDAEHAIRNVAIENLTINGQVVRELKDADIHVGPYVHDVRIGPK